MTGERFIPKVGKPILTLGWKDRTISARKAPSATVIVTEAWMTRRGVVESFRLVLKGQMGSMRILKLGSRVQKSYCHRGEDESRAHIGC
jgi:hypothetical protein